MLEYNSSFELEEIEKDIINNNYNIHDKNIIIIFLKKELDKLKSLDLEFDKNIEKNNNILKNINLQEKNNNFYNIEKINTNIKVLNRKLKYFEKEQEKNIILKREFISYLKEEIDDKLKLIKNINYNTQILENKKIKLSKNVKITTLNLKKKKNLDELKKIDILYKEEKDNFLQKKINKLELNKDKKKQILYEFQNKTKESNLMIEKNKSLKIHEINLIKLSLTKIKDTYINKCIQINNDEKNLKIEVAKKILDYNLKQREKEDNIKKKINNTNNNILLINENENNLNNEILEYQKNIKIKENNIKGYELKILNLKNFKNNILSLKLKKKKEEEKYNNINIFYKNKIKNILNFLKEKGIKVKKNKIYINKKKNENEERIKNILNLINNLKLNRDGEIKSI